MEIYNLIIIGAGPAGISAAINAKREKLNVLIIEKNKIGGKLNYRGIINNYPGFREKERKDLSEIMKNQLTDLGFKIEEEEEVISIKKENKIFVVKSENNVFFAKAVIIATGTTFKKINIEGEEKIGSFNNFYSMHENKDLPRNKIIAIIGGGYSGCEAANYLKEIAKKIYLVHNRKKINVSYQLEKSIIEDEKIFIFFNSKVKKIRSNKNLKFVSIVDKNDVEREIEVDLVIIYAGIESESKFVEDLNITDELNWVKVNRNFQTKIPGLFAAGDVIKKKYRQITTAISDGTIASFSAIDYLKKES